MDKCIVPDCACSGYKEPSLPKGILCFKGCATCNHELSLHRQLTATDKFVQEQITAVACKGCSNQIPVAEIPRSTVFRSHDAIHLPWGDFVPENSVVCPCAGFRLSGLTELMQMFHKRSHSTPDITKHLEETLCSFCQHPLTDHKGRDPTNCGKSEIPILGQVKFKSIAHLKTTAQLCDLVLDYSKRQFVFVCLHHNNKLEYLTVDWDQPKPDESPMETNEIPSRENKKKPQRGTRRSARIEARKRSVSKEPPPVVLAPEEGVARLLNELKQETNWKQTKAFPEELTELSSLACLSNANGLVIVVASLTKAWVYMGYNEESSWCALNHTPQQKHCYYTCISVTVYNGDEETLYAAMGTTTGRVIVWRINQTNIESSIEPAYCCQDYHSKVTVCKWSPDGGILAVGGSHGDVLLYNFENKFCLSQTLHVSGSLVSALDWSSNGRMLAVGGQDDCVQVLVVPQTTRRPTDPTMPSLYKYYKRTDGLGCKHAMTLKGHQSFVTAVQFTRSGSLLSTGLDEQVLVWTTPSQQHPAHHEESEPVAGFKIGPSASVKTKPLAVAAVTDGLLVTVVDKLSHVSLIHYSI